MAKKELLAVWVLMTCLPAFSHGVSIIRSCYSRRCGPAPQNCQFIRDPYGCLTCDLTCTAPGCEPVNCPIKCYNGFVRDENGCNTCTCKSECLERHCPVSIRCPYGFEMDQVGCPSCYCKPKPLMCHEFLNCPLGVCPNACACRPDCYDRGGNDEDRFVNFLRQQLQALA